MDASLLEVVIPIAGIVAVLFALYLARDVLSRDAGTQAMQDVAATIFEPLGPRTYHDAPNPEIPCPAAWPGEVSSAKK